MPLLHERRGSRTDHGKELAELQVSHDAKALFAVARGTGPRQDREQRHKNDSDGENDAFRANALSHRERRGVWGQLHRTVCYFRRCRQYDEHRWHVERDDRVDQQPNRTAQDGHHAIRGGRDRNLGFDVGELVGANQRRSPCDFLRRSAQVLRNGRGRDPLHGNGERGRTRLGIDDDLEQFDRGCRRIVSGSAARRSQDRCSASMRRRAPAHDRQQARSVAGSKLRTAHKA
jgi:hypothetical protein